MQFGSGIALTGPAAGSNVYGFTCTAPAVPGYYLAKIKGSDDTGRAVEVVSEVFQVTANGLPVPASLEQLYTGGFYGIDANPLGSTPVTAGDLGLYLAFHHISQQRAAMAKFTQFHLRLGYAGRVQLWYRGQHGRDLLQRFCRSRDLA